MKLNETFTAYAKALWLPGVVMLIMEEMARSSFSRNDTMGMVAFPLIVAGIGFEAWRRGRAVAATRASAPPPPAVE